MAGIKFDCAPAGPPWPHTAPRLPTYLVFQQNAAQVEVCLGQVGIEPDRRAIFRRRLEHLPWPNKGKCSRRRRNIARRSGSIPTWPSGLQPGRRFAGRGQLEAGELDEAIAACRSAIELNPGHAEAYSNLGNAVRNAGELNEALEMFGKAMALRPDNAEFHSNFVYTIYFHPDYDAAAILAANRRWAEKFESPLLAQHRGARERSQSRPAVEGWLCVAEFLRHALASFFLPLLSNHNRRNVEVFCYASVKGPDVVTSRMRHLSPHWRDCFAMSDVELAEQVRQDGIDILVDLSLHMANNRLLVFARKPAPVQVTWLGYPGTTGLSTHRLSADRSLSGPARVGDELQ